MKYEDLVKMSVKELKDRLKDLNTQAQAAAGKDLDALLEEATTITGILDDVKNREKLAGIAKDAEGGAEPTGGEKGEEVKDKAREERGQNINRRSGRRSRSRVEKHKPGFDWFLCEGVGQKEHLRKQEFQTKHGLQQDRLSVDTPS